MKTAVDSSVLFEIVKGAPGAAAAQTALEAALARGSLCVCAVVVAELGRYFASEQDLREFLGEKEKGTLPFSYTAEYLLSQSFSVASTRVCQPSPAARKGLYFVSLNALKVY